MCVCVCVFVRRKERFVDFGIRRQETLWRISVDEVCRPLTPFLPKVYFIIQQYVYNDGRYVVYRRTVREKHSHAHTHACTQASTCSHTYARMPAHAHCRLLTLVSVFLGHLHRGDNNSIAS